MSRKQSKRTAGNMAWIAIAGFFIVVIVGGVGLGVAAAGDVDDVARAGGFGFSEATHRATATPQSASQATYQARSSAAESESSAYLERSALASTAPRDISCGMIMITDMERAERERKIAENAAALKRVAAQKAMQGVGMSEAEINGAAPAAGSFEYDLPTVDWSVGQDAFIAEWANRIDAYLVGSELEGYGRVFAEAAWENGVDPRWSPAISNTESGKGAVCFLPCNAWGWGSAGWNDWDSAIRAHIAGLAKGYGYSITASAAQAYCPPTWSEWYEKTLEQMALI